MTDVVRRTQPGRESKFGCVSSVGVAGMLSWDVFDLPCDEEKRRMPMTEPSMADPKPSVLSANSPCRFRRLRKLTSHIPPGQFVRYLLVGTWNTLFGYAVYALFTALLMHKSRFGYLYAAVLSGIVSITVAYFGYKFFVFRTRGRYWTEWFRCVLVYGTAMLPGLILLPIAVEALRHGFHLGASAPYLGGALTTGFTAFYSFLGHKHFTFRSPAQVSCESAEAKPAPGDATNPR